MKSELIYGEDGVLHITKQNGLRYSFENVDPPALGFEYEVLIYADLEIKIEKWEDGKHFDEQESLFLTDADKDSIELYIENSEPPLGFNLNRQYINEINNVCHDFVNEQMKMIGFVR